MKRFLILAASLFAMLIFTGCSNSPQQQAALSDSGAQTSVQSENDAAAPKSSENQRILVAYFSHSGNTRNIAAQIHAAVGGDLFEIQTVKQYNTDFETTVAEALLEQKSNARPALAAKVADMQAYDVVFLGFPNWCGTMPMALFTFMEQYDFSGKNIVPFCTHGSSGLSNTIDDLKKLAPSSAVQKALSLHRSEVRTADAAVKTWLRELSYTH